MHSRHRVVDAFRSDLQKAVLETIRRRSVEYEDLVRTICDDLQRRHRVREVVEDAFEEADIEPLAPELLGDLEQVTNLESDLVVGLAEVLLEEPGLLDPVLAYVESEAVRTEI